LNFIFDGKIFNPVSVIEEDNLVIYMNNFGNYLQLNQKVTTAAMKSLWIASEEFADNLNQIKNVQQHTANSVT
jgi:hypothetical protein